MCLCARARARVCVRVRACVRACVCVRARTGLATFVSVLVNLVYKNCECVIRPDVTQSMRLTDWRKKSENSLTQLLSDVRSVSLHFVTQ